MAGFRAFWTSVQGFLAYSEDQRCAILMRMADNKSQLKGASIEPLEFMNGCPACERTDPQLERELQAFAQLFFDIYLESHEAKKPPDSNHGVDKMQ